MAKILFIDSEPETIAAVAAAGHSAQAVEIGYRTGRRNFLYPPHEFDLLICDLKNPACFDSTYWGPGRNDNFHCKIVESPSNEAFLQDGELRYKHTLIQESQLSPIVAGTFGPNDVLRAIRDAGTPFLLLLNDEWVKRARRFPDFFNLRWDFKATLSTKFTIMEHLSDTLATAKEPPRLSIPLKHALASGPTGFHGTKMAFEWEPLVVNSVGDIFAQLVSVGRGLIWILPPFKDNVKFITHVADNPAPYSSLVPRAPAAKALPVAPADLGKPAAMNSQIVKAKPDNRAIFVVHGRDERLRDGMFAFLRSLDLRPLEWAEAVRLTGKASPYIGEILDTAFSYAQAVVVLLTPDDEARLRESLWGKHEQSYETQFTPQARPNVLFEAGMAMARDSDRTILVQIGNLRPFSDVAGRHSILMDNSPKKRYELIGRLQSAGCGVNVNGTDWQTAGDLTPETDGTATNLSPNGPVSTENPKPAAGLNLSKFRRVLLTPISRSTTETEYTLERVDETGVVIQLGNGLLVHIPKADYHESWDLTKEKPKLVLTRKYFQGYFPGHESAEEYFLPR